MDKENVRKLLIRMLSARKLVKIQLTFVVCMYSMKTTYQSKKKCGDLMTNLEKDWPSLSCPRSNGFTLRFWSHEWEKNGTCSESQLDQHEYFEAALNLKKKVNLLQILRIARIEPDDGFYSLDNIVK